MKLQLYCLDVNNKLYVNTLGSFIPFYGDLSLASTPSNITLNSSHHVVATQLTQIFTRISFLNVLVVTLKIEIMSHI
jgi:hypothetical protein